MSSKSIMKTIYHHTLQPLIRKIINGITSTPKESVIKLAMQFASQCNQGGDYWEFGVYKGASFISAFKCNKKFAEIE